MEFTFDNMGTGSGSGLSYWNYSKKTDDDGNPRADYTPTITGDIVEMEQVQQTDFETGKPLFWKDRQKSFEETDSPCLDFQIVVATPMGELAWTFNPKAKKTQQNPKGLSQASQAIFEGMSSAGLGNSLNILLGKNVTISTPEPPAGFSYSASNPRRWQFRVNGQGSAVPRGAFAFGEKAKKTPKAEMPSALQAAMANAQAAVTANAQQVSAGTMPPADVYGDEIPF